MFTDLIRGMLEDIFGGVNSGDIAANITMSPSAAFGDDFWGSLLHLGAIAIMPFAITLLCFFLASEFYSVYVKANGELDLQLVVTTVVKFLLPFLLITKTYDLVAWIYRLFNSLILNMSRGLTDSGTLDATGAVAEIMKTVQEMKWYEQLGYMLQLFPLSLGMLIMSTVIFVIVYGRLFEIIIFWIFAPLPFATLVHSEHHQIGSNYLKMFTALIFQGAIMFACVAMYSMLVKNLAVAPGAEGGWQMLGYSAVLIFTLAKTGNMAKRMFGTF